MAQVFGWAKTTAELSLWAKPVPVELGSLRGGYGKAEARKLI